MEIVAYDSPKRLVEFIDVDNIAGYIQEIENEIDAFLGLCTLEECLQKG